MQGPPACETATAAHQVPPGEYASVPPLPGLFMLEGKRDLSKQNKQDCLC